MTADVLGDELLAAILSLLPASDLAAAEAACRRWRDVSSSHGLWQALTPRHHPPPQRHGLSPALQAALHPQARQQQQEASASEADQEGWTDKQRFLHAKWSAIFSGSPDYVRLSRLVPGAHPAPVTSLSALPGTGLLLSASAEGAVRLWRLPDPRSRSAAAATTATASSAAAALPAPRLLCSAQHGSAVLFVHLFSAELAVAATASDISVWRIEDEGAAGSSSAGTSAAGTSAAAAAAAAGVRMRLLRRMGLSPGGGQGSSSGGSGSSLICAAAWDMFVAAGCRDGSIRVFDIYSGACRAISPRLHPGGVACLQAVRHPAADLDLLISGGRDGRVLVSDADTSLTLAEASLPRGAVTSLCANPATGRLLVASCETSREHFRCLLLGRQLSSVPLPAQRLGMPANARLQASWSLSMLDAANEALLGVANAALPPFGSDFFAFSSKADYTRISITSAQNGATAVWLQRLAAATSNNGGAGAAAAAAAAAGQPRPASQQVAGHLGSSLPSQASSSAQAGPPQAGAPRSSDAGSPCTAVCAAGLPLVAGYQDGSLCFWRWVRREAGGQQADGQQARQQAGQQQQAREEG